MEATDRISISFVSNHDILWSGGNLDPSLAAQLVAGFHTGVISAEPPGTTPWNYDSSGVDLRFLDGGETIRFSYTITATDPHQATAETTVEFVVTGTTYVHVEVCLIVTMCRSDER